MMNGIDIFWLLFKAFYIIGFIFGTGLFVLFLMRFKPTARIIKNIFNADINWD